MKTAKYNRLVSFKKWSLLLLITTLFSVSYNAYAWNPPTIQSFGFNECDNSASFRFYYNIQRRNHHGISHCDQPNDEIHSGWVQIVVGGTAHNIIEIKHGRISGWKQFKADGKSDRWISFRELYSWGKVNKGNRDTHNDDCTIGLGRTTYTHWANVDVDVPSQYSGNGQQVYFKITGNWDGGGNNINSSSSTVRMLNLNKPSAFTADQECGFVKLTWNRPNFECPDDADFVLYRDGNVVETIGYNSTLEYIDNNGSELPYKAGGYDYEVRLRFKSNQHDYSDAATLTTNPKRQFDDPNYFKNVQLNVLNECSRSIKIDWEIEDDVNIQKFVIERSTDNSFPSATTELFTYDNKIAPFSFTNNDVPVDDIYYYRVRGYDECSNSHVTSPVQQIYFEGKPFAPAITEVTPLPNGTVRINFSHDNEKVEKFKIYRDGIQIGLVQEGLSTDYEFIDDDASNCITYRYRIDAIGKCYENKPVASQDVEQQISFNTELDGFNSFTASKFYFTDRVSLEWDLSASQASEVVVFRKREGSGDFYREIARLPVPSSYYEDYDTEPGILYNYGVMAVACDGYVPVTSEYDLMVTNLGGRSEYGVINGKVTYEGGNSVEGVRVIAASSSGESRGVSLFNESNQITIPLEKDGSNWFPKDDWTISFWMQMETDSPSEKIFKVANSTDSIYLEAVMNGTEDFHDIEKTESFSIEGLVDELIGYKGSNNQITSLQDGSVIGFQDGSNFTELEKIEISGLTNADTLFDFISREPWLIKDGNDWYDVVTQSTNVAVPDALYGYLIGDTIYEAYDSDFVLAFIADDKLRLAEHFNVSYQTGDQYGYIKDNQFFFREESIQAGVIVDDTIYSAENQPVHVIRGNNVFYVYKDELTNKFVRGKRFARRVINDTDPEISYDVFLLEKVITEEIRRGEVLGVVATDRSKVFDPDNAGLINYLIDESGVVRSAVYENKQIYVPNDIKFTDHEGIIKNLADDIVYLFNESRDTLYSVESNELIIDSENFVKDPSSGDYKYYLGDLIGGEQQVFKAINNEVITVTDQIVNSYTKSAYYISTVTNGSAVSTGDLYVGDYNNIALVYKDSELVFLLNGDPVDTIRSYDPSSIMQTVNQQLQFGEFSGHIDEVLVWDHAKSIEAVKRDYNRYLTGGEDHLVGYWRLDEAISSYIFDASFEIDQTGKKVFHEHHGQISDANGWSNVVPEQEDLSFTAYTDDEGNYSIQSIIYVGAGNNFRVVPIFGSHKFEPANEVMFLGKSEQVHNQIDFTDVSSFTVTGTVKYAPTILGFDSNDDLSAPNCYVESVDILIDGQPVIKDGSIVKTDKNGRFEIEVPIGKHKISVARQNHTFVETTWPPTGTFDFQQDQFDLEFFDNTTRFLLGKVVGGTTEGNKLSGTRTSKNNIGIAQIKLKSIGKTCFETIIETDSLTGEYHAELPPFRYNIVDINIKSQDAIFNRELRKLATASVNLDRDTLDLQTVNCSGTNCPVSFYDYHLMRDFIFRNKAELLVTSQSEQFPNTLGDTIWFDAQDTQIDISHIPLPYEMFRTDFAYDWFITLSEQYINNDAPYFDSDLYDPEIYNDTIRNGSVYIENNIANEFLQLDLSQGRVPYSFVAGEASLLMDRQNPEQSFTKTVQIYSENTNWRADDDVFRGYVFGTVQDPTQQSFYTLSNATQEYQVIDFILRDPPGSQSYSKLTEKSKITKVRTSSFKDGIEQETRLGLGHMIEIAAGSPVLQVKSVVMKNTVGPKTKTQQYRVGEQTSIISFEEMDEISTSDKALNTGAGSDIFVGNSINVFFSPSNNIELIPLSDCGSGGKECYPIQFEIDGEDYSISRSKSVSFGINEQPTIFYYTQRQIEQFISDLERDIEFVSDQVQQSRMRNQIRIWKAALAQNEYEKLVAKHAMSFDETQRLEQNVDANNYSFGYGSKINKAYKLGVDQSFNYSEQFNWYLGLNLELETLISSLYIKLNLDLGYAAYVSTSDKSQIQDSREISLHLEDNDPGDIYSVDVVMNNFPSVSQEFSTAMNDAYEQFNYSAGDGLFPTAISIADVDNSYKHGQLSDNKYYNPVFITRGGRTSCPYEPEEKVKYLEYLDSTLLAKLDDLGIIESFSFDNASKESVIQYKDEAVQDMVLNYGTFQRDQPGLEIEPRVKRNVPWDTRAQFDIILENHNVEDTIRTYKLFVDQRTTGPGPTMRLDGERFIKGTDIPLYGGEQLRKTFTLRPLRDIYEYEDIVIYLATGCQFDFGQDLDFQEDIFDRDSISAYFDPVCPRATEIIPTAGWIINNTTGSKLNVEIQEQEFYFENHSKVILQYKAAYQSDEDWVDIAIWSRDAEEVNELINTGENAFMFDDDNNYIVYDWETADYPTPDGEYQIRWKYFCVNGLESESAPIPGIIDRTSPHAFGRPSPADGILSPNDEILLTLNEPIEEGLVDRDLIKVSGKVNGTPLAHPVSLRFNGSESEIVSAENISLKKMPVSVEMWVRKDHEFATSEELLFSHGELNGSKVLFSLTESGHLKLDVNGSILTTPNPVSLDEWSHIAFTYDPNEKKANIYKNATSLASGDFFTGFHYADGPVYIGGNGQNTFTGNIHEVRIWNEYKRDADIAPNFYKDLTGREIGLVAYWRFDEGMGELAEERVQGRNASVATSWSIEPSTLSFEFDGTNHLNLPGVAIEHQENFTLEFWFKADQLSIADTMNLFNNGYDISAESTHDLEWGINITPLGQIELIHDDVHHIVIDESVLDQKWHQLAIVVNRIGNTNFYLDAELQSSISSSSLNGFGGPGMWLGARRTSDVNADLETEVMFDEHFIGKVDEFRIWGLARRQEQIKRDCHYKLEGDEIGLKGYVPFESYNDFLRITEGSLVMHIAEKDNKVGSATTELFSTDHPPVISKPAQTPVYFDYSTNGNQIIITLDEDNPATVENCILDISVRNLIDKNGNVMQSPETWSVYVDRNQVVWESRRMDFVKLVNEELEFTTKVVNQGGENQNFSITNLPAWLTAAPQTGELEPDSEEIITFTVNPGLNIGTYSEPVYLTSDFGFNETFILNMDVSQPLPGNWDFDATQYQNSMSFIGMIKIKDQISIDKNDVIAAFVNDTIRGRANLNYLDVYDNYQAFLNIYSNELDGEELEFRIWDASEGRVLTDVDVIGIVEDPVIFRSNEIIGIPGAPLIFESADRLLREIAVPKGWKWISFNVNSEALQRTSEVFSDVVKSDGDRILSATDLDIYDATNDLWMGNIAGDNLPNGVGGFEIAKSYRVFVENEGELAFKGIPVDAPATPISLQSSGENGLKWNWISFLGQDNMDINEALASLQPSAGDIIKSQHSFAIYDPALKWIGNLEYLQPGEGYMIKVATDQELVFPESGLITGRPEDLKKTNDLNAKWDLNVHSFSENMSLICALDVTSNIDLSNSELVAYYRGDVVGVSKPIFNSETQEHLFMLTINGDPEYEQVYFKLWEEEESYLIQEQVEFLPNYSIGQVNDPAILTEIESNDRVELMAFPNPFNDEVNILIPTLNVERIGLKITSIDGRLILTKQFEGIETNYIEFEWNGRSNDGHQVSAGSYVVEYIYPDRTESSVLIKN